MKEDKRKTQRLNSGITVFYDGSYGRTKDISIDGNYAYLMSSQGGELYERRPLYIVDITNLESPVHVYPGDPYSILSRLAKILLIAGGVVIGLPVLVLAIVLPIVLTRKKKKDMVVVPK